MIKFEYKVHVWTVRRKLEQPEKTDPSKERTINLEGGRLK